LSLCAARARDHSASEENFKPVTSGVPMTRRALLVLLAQMPIGRALACSHWTFVRVQTSLGVIIVEPDLVRAPLTAGNFLQLIEAKAYDGNGSFYRSVAPTRDDNPVPINVIQGGIGRAPSPLPPIAHESTATTGLRHVDGTISMARAAIGTASSEFFICIGDNPELDAGGKRVADGEGFAAFGRVISGMDVVRRIHALPTSVQGAGTAVAGQMLANPVGIIRVEKC